jgi:hypothetical protein
MSKIVKFKPRKPLARPTEELPHYHSIVCELSELTTQDRLSVIAASCPDEDYSELLELAAYAVGPRAIDIVKKVLEQAGDRMSQEPAE